MQFAAILDRHTIESRIWERGAGETSARVGLLRVRLLASHRLGKVGPNVEMRMPGGVLKVDIDPTWHVRLCGPVEGVANMETHL